MSTAPLEQYPPISCTQANTPPATLAHPALAQFGGWGGAGWNGGNSGSSSSGFGGGSSSGSSSDGDGSSSSSFGFGYGEGFDYETAISRRSAHGIVATVAFVILFPLGAIFLRVIPGRWSVRIHYVVQILAWLLYIAGFVLGVLLLRMLPSGAGQSLVSAYLVISARMPLIAKSDCVLG